MVVDHLAEGSLPTPVSISMKHFTLVNYDSRVVIYAVFGQDGSRVIIYERKCL